MNGTDLLLLFVTLFVFMVFGSEALKETVLVGKPTEITLTFLLATGFIFLLLLLNVTNII